MENQFAFADNGMIAACVSMICLSLATSPFSWEKAFIVGALLVYDDEHAFRSVSHWRLKLEALVPFLNAVISGRPDWSTSGWSHRLTTGLSHRLTSM